MSSSGGGGDGGGGGGLLGHRSAAFWQVLTGVLTVLTLLVGLIVKLTSGSDGPQMPWPPPPTVSVTPVGGGATTSSPPGRATSPEASTTPPRPLRPLVAAPTPRTAPPAPGPLRYTFQGISQYPCSMEGRLRSLFQAPTSLRIDNRSSQYIQLYYLDATGNRVPQVTIAPHRYYDVSTHLGDAWLTATTQAECIGIFVLRGRGLVQFNDPG